MRKKSTDVALRVAVIGCGRMGSAHVEHLLKRFPREDIAVCDINPIRVQTFTDQYSVVNSFTDVGDMVSQFKPDVCHITTPPTTHAAIARVCLQEGIHIYIEKPMCVTPAEADELIILSRAKNAKICVGHQLLFEKELSEALDFLAQEELGQIMRVRVVDVRNIVGTAAAHQIIGRFLDLPGGIFFDLLPHRLYLLHKLAPQAKLRFGCAERLPGYGAVDLLGIYDNVDGVIGQLFISLRGKVPQNYVEVELDAGTLYVDFRGRAIIRWKRPRKIPDAVAVFLKNASWGRQLIGGSLRNGMHFAFGRVRPYQGTSQLIDAFHRAIVRDQPSPVPPEEGRAVVVEALELIHQAGLQTQGYPSREPKMPANHADVLVIGGTGFIGRRLVMRLSAGGYKVRVLARSPRLTSCSMPEGAQLIHGDARNETDVGEVLRGVQVVYHLAATTKGDFFAHLNTVEATKNVLDTFQKTATKAKLIYVSSLSVYAQALSKRNKKISEEFPCEEFPRRRGAYCFAKLWAENLVRSTMESGTIAGCIIRPGMVYGPGRDPFSVLGPNFEFALLGIRFRVVLGCPWRKLHLCYVDNLVDALILAAEKSESSARIFNIVDCDVPQARYIKYLKRATRDRWVTIYVPFVVARTLAGLINFWAAYAYKRPISIGYKLKSLARWGGVRINTQAARQHLGWKPRIPLREGIRRSVDGA